MGFKTYFKIKLANQCCSPISSPTKHIRRSFVTLPTYSSLDKWGTVCGAAKSWTQLSEHIHTDSKIWWEKENVARFL